jgi:hypothetical protein
MAARALPKGGAVTADMLNDLIRQRPSHASVALRGYMGAQKN